MAFEQPSRRYGHFYRNVQKYASRKEVLISSYLILSLFTVSFFAAVFIKPTAVTIAKLWREIQDKKEIFTKLENKIGDLEEAQVLYADIESDLVFLDRALPANPEFVKLLQEIGYLINRNQLVISSAQYGPVEIYSAREATQTASQLIEQSLNMTLDGSFINIKNFLQEIENFDRIVTLELVKIDTQKKQNNEPGLKLVLFLDAKAYSFAEGMDLK